MAPTTKTVLSLLRNQGTHGVTAMDAMRAHGIAGSSLTKRISELRDMGADIIHTQHVDPITKRRYGRYTLSERVAA